MKAGQSTESIGPRIGRGNLQTAGPFIERTDVSVIARKIAKAAESDPARPAADTIATWLLPNIKRVLTQWLSSEELRLRNVTARWALGDLAPLPDIIMAAKGPKVGEAGQDTSSRMAIAMPRAMIDMAAYRLLSIAPSSEESARDRLAPFIDQNTLSLGVEAAQFAWPDHTAEWTFETPETVTKLFSETRAFRMEMDCCESDEVNYRIALIVSPDMLRASAPKTDDEADAANDRRLSPRLGPCHVEIQAVADHVRMSVADCSRLEIGQLVALPRLRFDRLELKIEMGEGPVPLVDAALGADKGRKAVRLNRGLDPSFREPLPSPHPAGSVPV